MILLKAYQYLFYKLYRFYEISIFSRWWSEWKAYVSMLALSIWFYLGTETTYHYFYNIPIKSSYTNTYSSIIIFGSIVAFINWFLFEHKNKWKSIVDEFDRLPKKDNMIGGVIIWFVIIFIIVFYWAYSIPLLGMVKYQL